MCKFQEKSFDVEMFIYILIYELYNIKGCFEASMPSVILSITVVVSLGPTLVLKDIR